ncbi:MAG: hypothetical protein NT013_16560 [Planctomycetia bacterium]|nr:hypothetical protein [Planctomycetia bacterium]
MFKTPRHVVAAIGALVTIQGILFTIIDHNRFSLAFTLAGLLIVAGGLHIETLAAIKEAKINLDWLLEWFGSYLRERAAHRAEQREQLRLRQPEETLPVSEPANDPDARTRSQPSRDQDFDDEQCAGTEYERSTMLWSPGTAAVLSLIIPGLGQLYKGHPFKSLAWFVFVVSGYAAMAIPGVILHACCVLGAFSGDPTTVVVEGNQTYHVQVVGTSHHQRELTRLAGGKKPDSASVFINAVLAYEDSNKHDRNAIVVTINGIEVGHLERTNARLHRMHMEAAQLSGSTCQCAALIIGGWKRRRWFRVVDEGHFGVRLDIPWL